jgi:hypothetical protein
MTVETDTYIYIQLALIVIGAMLLGGFSVLIYQQFLRVKKPDPKYNPWSDGVFHYEEPMPWMDEKPISGRKK